MDTTVVWGPATLALGLGALVGLLMALQRAVRMHAAPGCEKAATIMAKENDERELDFTLASLRELDEGRERLQPAGYQEEKARLEALAVALLHKVRAAQTSTSDEPTAAPLAPAARASAQRASHARQSRFVAFFAQRPLVRRFAWTGALVAVVAFLGSNLRQNMAPSDSGAPGPMAAAAGAGEMPSAQELEALRARIEQNPQDAEALLRVAHLALRAQQFAEAQAFNDRALAAEPKSLEGRTHKAVLQAKDGELDAAMSALGDVVHDNPGFAEAWFFRGMLSMQAGDMDTMRVAFGQFLTVAPDGPQKDRVRAMLERSKS